MSSIWHLCRLMAAGLGRPAPSLARVRDFLQVPEQKTDGERLRARLVEVNNVAGAIERSARDIGLSHG